VKVLTHQSMLWWRRYLSLDQRLTADTVCSWESLSTTKQFILTSCHWQQHSA